MNSILNLALQFVGQQIVTEFIVQLNAVSTCLMTDLLKPVLINRITWFLKHWCPATHPLLSSLILFYQVSLALFAGIVVSGTLWLMLCWCSLKTNKTRTKLLIYSVYCKILIRYRCNKVLFISENKTCLWLLLPHYLVVA